MKRWLQKWRARRFFRKWRGKDTDEWPDDYIEIDMTPEQRKKFVEDIMLIAAKPMLIAFKMCKLQTHMTVTIYNEPTKEFFQLSFNKIETSITPR